MELFEVAVLTSSVSWTRSGDLLSTGSSDQVMGSAAPAAETNAGNNQAVRSGM